MPRRLRLHVPGAFFHVTLRGNHRNAIFEQPGDRLTIERLVAESIALFDARVHAYCWMTNHVHLLLQTGAAPLGKIMQRIAARYARIVQARSPTTGHLFERRYFAVLVDADAYLLRLVRYIHHNPVRAGLVDCLDDYPWSSHQAYLGLCEKPWLTTDFCLSLFDGSLGIARQAYARFMVDHVETRSDFGALVNPNDDRILGSNAFMLAVAGTPAPTRAKRTLDGLLRDICCDYGLDPADLAASGKDRRCCEARAIVTRLAIEDKLASIAELARRFHRDESSLRKSLRRHTVAKCPNARTGTGVISSRKTPRPPD
jgi:putative transposase